MGRFLNSFPCAVAVLETSGKNILLSDLLLKSRLNLHGLLKISNNLSGTSAHMPFISVFFEGLSKPFRWLGCHVCAADSFGNTPGEGHEFVGL
jgi:hypothetical protein